MTAKLTLTDAEWREKLTPRSSTACCARRAPSARSPASTEKNKAAGEYVCAGCGQPLFESDAKFDSGSGWPSFTRPAGDGAVDEHRDADHGMVRAEVVCSAAAGHLGHVFPDGPRGEGELRYCINSAALDFKPEDN